MVSRRFFAAASLSLPPGVKFQQRREHPFEGRGSQSSEKLFLRRNIRLPLDAKNLPHVRYEAPEVPGLAQVSVAMNNWTEQQVVVALDIHREPGMAVEDRRNQRGAGARRPQNKEVRR